MRQRIVLQIGLSVNIGLHGKCDSAVFLLFFCIILPRLIKLYAKHIAIVHICHIYRFTEQKLSKRVKI